MIIAQTQGSCNILTNVFIFDVLFIRFSSHRMQIIVAKQRYKRRELVSHRVQIVAAQGVNSRLGLTVYYCDFKLCFIRSDGL